MSVEKTYPFESAFQEKILAVMLKDPVFLIRYRECVSPGYFENSDHSTIVSSFIEYYDKYHTLPSKVAFTEELRAKFDRYRFDRDDSQRLFNLMHKLYNLDTIEYQQVCDRVGNFGKKQLFKTQLVKVISLMDSTRDDFSEDNCEKAMKLIEVALTAGYDVNDLGFNFFKSMPDIPSMAAQTALGADKKIKTGFPTLDRHTRGGFSRGELWIIAGYAGRGKSALAVNFATAAMKEGLCVAHYTIGDLCKIDVAVRYAARYTRLNIDDVCANDEKYMRLARKSSMIAPRLYIKDYPADSITVDHIRAHLTRVRHIEGFVPALTIIDYPEEMKRGSDNTYLDIGDTYSKLANIGKEFDTAIITISHAKEEDRKYEGELIKAGQMGDSKKKWRKADGIMTWNMSADEEKSGSGVLWVDKVRRNKCFYPVYCNVDLARMLIEEGTRPAKEGVAASE